MPHCGLAGVMRNEGIDRRRRILPVSDGDDFFEPEMLEHSLRKAREDDADICMFDARMYYEATKTIKKKQCYSQDGVYPGADTFLRGNLFRIFSI